MRPDSGPEVYSMSAPHVPVLTNVKFQMHVKQVLVQTDTVLYLN
jgi:hypothetical protein